MYAYRLRVCIAKKYPGVYLKFYRWSASMMRGERSSHIDMTIVICAIPDTGIGIIL